MRAASEKRQGTKSRKVIGKAFRSWAALRTDECWKDEAGQLLKFTIGAILGHRSSPRRPGRRTQRIKARLLFVAQRIVEFHERGPYGLHSAERGVEPLLHRLDSSGRGQRLI